MRFISKPLICLAIVAINISLAIVEFTHLICHDNSLQSIQNRISQSEYSLWEWLLKTGRN